MVSRTVLLSILLVFLMLPLGRAGDPAVLDKTTYGKSQNDDRDLVNSLTAAPAETYGKGEKKAQVNSAELKSKSTNDTTFGGSLLNMGIGSNVPKLDESKLRAAPVDTQSRQQPAATEKEPTIAKQTAPVEKQTSASSQSAEVQPVFSNLSTTATLEENLRQSNVPATSEKDSKASGSNSTTANTENGNAQKKDQSGGSTDAKPSTTSSSEKSSDPKPDGDH